MLSSNSNHRFFWITPEHGEEKDDPAQTSGQRPATEHEERPPTPPTPKQKRKADPESVTPLLRNQPDPYANIANNMPPLDLN
jgi:hypothetical protein